VLTLAAGRSISPVWRNELGGLTFAIGDTHYVKWNPTGNGIDLEVELRRLDWAAKFVTVPRVVDHGADEHGSWLVSEAIAGTSAVSDRWRRHPEIAVPALGRGLRHLHDRMPVASCPFGWTRQQRLAVVKGRAEAGSIEFERVSAEHRDLDAQTALRILDDAPDDDRLVVCHGDACAPNTVLAEDGTVAGHVDFGSLGVGDRWADLAISTWSTNWNYGPGWETPLLVAYGVEPDPTRTAYYRLLWDLGP
jgi:kanamycin kinase